jgi:hypothetical protein
MLLSVIDFEWTVRRAIIALGVEPTKDIRLDLEGCHGLDAYKKAWKKHVFPPTQHGLALVVPSWAFLKKQVFPLRHKIVHGVSVRAGEAFAAERRDCALEASAAICNFASSRGVNLYQRLPVRTKVKVLTSKSV